MTGVVHVDCPGCGAPVDPRSTGGHTIRCGYCGAVGVVRRQGDRLVIEPTLIGAAAGQALTLWNHAGLALAGLAGVATLVVIAMQATRPSLGAPVPLAVVVLVASLVLRTRASPLLGPILAMVTGLVMASKPFVFPLRIGRFGAFSPTSETAFHWLVPGVVLGAVALLMVGTLTRPRLVASVRGLVPGRRALLVLALGAALGVALGTWTTRPTLWETLDAKQAMLDALEARLSAASALRTDAPLPADTLAALAQRPEEVDMLLRSELSGALAPDARYSTTGVISPLLEVRRQLRTADEDHYLGDLHEPMHEGRQRAFVRAKALRSIVIVDLDPPNPQSQPSGTLFTATGTVVDLEGPVALGAVTGPPDSSAYRAIVRLEEALGLPRRR